MRARERERERERERDREREMNNRKRQTGIQHILSKIYFVVITLSKNANKLNGFQSHNEKVRFSF